MLLKVWIVNTILKIKRLNNRFDLQSFLVQQVFFACDTPGVLTDVTQTYSLIWHIHCFLKLNPYHQAPICFLEHGCSDEGQNISLSAGKGKEIPFPNKNSVVFVANVDQR